MTVATVLPPNATELERAIEQTTARLLDVQTHIRSVWRPDDCPIELLPWLAWSLSLDNWASDWPEAIKRERVRKALIIARSKGTAQSVRAVVASFGGGVAISEWWQKVPRGNPHTFDLVLNLESDGAPATAAFVDQVVAEVHRVKPVRSHFTFTQGINARGGIAIAGAVRPVIYTRLSLDAPAA